MWQALRHEILLLVGLAIVAFAARVVLGPSAWLLPAALAVYLSWNLVNLVRLIAWIRRGTFRPPLSVGIWEQVFDGLQRRKFQERRRKRALLSFLAQLRDAAATLPDAAVVLDQRNRLRWFNPAARKYLGLSWPGNANQDISEVVTHPVFVEFLERADFSRVLELPSPANGAWMLSIQIAPFRETRQRLLVARDISQFYKLEQKRRDFVASVSHELRTPLTVFRGYLEPLVEAVSDYPEWALPVQQLEQQSERMQYLVEDLLTLSRLDLSDRMRLEKQVNVPDLIRTVEQEAKKLASYSDHAITSEVEHDLWIQGNDADLRSVVSNLVFNAINHTPRGSRITIDWRRKNGGAELRVADDGNGIASYHLPRLTERFYRVDTSRSRKSGGTGLGLAIVKQLLDSYEAELIIDSRPGSGSVFTCEFPEDRVLTVRRLRGRAVTSRASSY